MEASYPLEFQGIANISTMMTDQMVSIILEKTDNDNREILEGISEAVSGDAKADEEIRKLF